MQSGKYNKRPHEEQHVLIQKLLRTDCCHFRELEMMSQNNSWARRRGGIREWGERELEH